MKISARVENHAGQHHVALRTDGHDHSISIPPKAAGSGSSVNGGELLFLALATCYCNDNYREAAKRQIQVEQVEVEVEGEPAKNIAYRAKVTARASEDEIRALMDQTNRVAEIQNTLRYGTPVRLTEIVAVRV